MTLFGCWFFGPRPEDGPVPGYQSAILLQGSFQLVEPKTPVLGPSLVLPQLQVASSMVVFLSVVRSVVCDPWKHTQGLVIVNVLETHTKNTANLAPTLQVRQPW